MIPERKAQVKELRQRLANLSVEERQVFASRGMIATVEGRTLSLHNTLLVYLQSNGRAPSIVGGYKQWKTAGRQVKRGEHGYTIWFPVGNKNEDTGDITEAQTFYCGTVFDIGQTEEAI